MCLNLRRDYDEPYNKTNIGWKFGRIAPDGSIYSFYRVVWYKKGIWMEAFVYEDSKKFDTYDKESSLLFALTRFFSSIISDFAGFNILVNVI